MAANATQQYQHTALNHPRCEIRLCRLASSSSDIKLDIAHYILDEVEAYEYTNDDGILFAYSGDKTRTVSSIASNRQGRKEAYTAISYCWGEVTISHIIKLNGRTFEVSDNLYQLLSVLRDRNEKRWFWIDQICINQRDVEERNAQVSLMSFIYSSAEAVFAWLGGSTATTGLGFRMLERLEEKAAQFASEQGLTDEEEEGLRAVGELLSREYWTRLWIVQEVVYARKLFLLCGPHMHHFTKDPETMGLEVWMLAFSRTSSWNNPSTNTSEQCNRKLATTPHPWTRSPPYTSETSSVPRSHQLLRETLSLLSDHLFMASSRGDNSAGFLLSFDAVAAHAWRGCRDPRDKVFAIQALVSPNHRVLVDYRKSARDVFDEWMHETDTRKRYIPPEPGYVRATISELYTAMGLGELEARELDKWLKVQDNSGKRPGVAGAVDLEPEQR